MAGQPTSVLDGIPLAVKGNFALKDIPMNTARTQLLRDNVPSECASLVRNAFLCMQPVSRAFLGVHFIIEHSLLLLSIVNTSAKQCRLWVFCRASLLHNFNDYDTMMCTMAGEKAIGSWQRFLREDGCQ